ncbi:MAG TPA: MaoC/PaaZ C-terminal domain-containing protein [Actinomycetota bacterium]|nr:MaoC/PaaZ C-terminal domain-containing protein [Actinomycetota bacterium]
MNASVGDELPELRRVVIAADVAAYAEAGGDRNPLHLDDAFARSVGFDGVIGHGMFTMGHMAAAVTAWAGSDAVVERINAQFRAPVFMGEEVRAGGTVRAVEGDTVTVDTWVAVERDGATEWPIKKGQVVLRIVPVA